MAALALAVFTVSVGYGIVLPLLPDLLELRRADLASREAERRARAATAGSPKAERRTVDDIL